VESVLIDPNLRDGDPKAPVVLFVYSDFECPFCASFASQVLPALRAEFVVPGTLQIVFAHFPMERLHEEAVWKSQAAHCAGQQGRFWPAHDLIFRHRASTRESIKADMISSVGLSMPLLDDCLSSDGSMQMIRKSMEAALRFGVNSTPTFFVGTLRGDGSVDVARTSVGMDAAAHLPTDIRDVLRMAGR
jgi:protein-disulfide isomerase